MEITLNHTIVPSHNNVESAKFYERIFGFEFVKEWGHFAVVRVNPTLVLDFITVPLTIIPKRADLDLSYNQAEDHREAGQANPVFRIK